MHSDYYEFDFLREFFGLRYPIILFEKIMYLILLNYKFIIEKLKSVFNKIENSNTVAELTRILQIIEWHSHGATHFERT